MNKYELNRYAVTLMEKAFQEQGFIIEKSPASVGQVNFHAVSSKGRTLKIKVRSISQRGSYIFVEKTKFNVKDPDLFMAVLYLPYDKEEWIIYLVPAAEWANDIYPFKGKDYNKPGQVSAPEWGISFSDKAKYAMEPYRFANIIANYA